MPNGDFGHGDDRTPLQIITDHVRSLEEQVRNLVKKTNTLEKAVKVLEKENEALKMVISLKRRAEDDG